MRVLGLRPKRPEDCHVDERHRSPRRNTVLRPHVYVVFPDSHWWIWRSINGKRA